MTSSARPSCGPGTWTGWPSCPSANRPPSRFWITRNRPPARTPGPIAPARELYGAMLLERGMAKEALAAFEATLKKEPHRLGATLGAAKAAEKLLSTCGRELAPQLLNFYAAVIWEDQDECLEVRPEDLAV